MFTRAPLRNADSFPHGPIMTSDDDSTSGRLLPGWLTSDGESEGPGQGGRFRGSLERIVQLRDGMRAAVPALPDAHADAGTRAQEVAESAASRARALVSAVEGEAGGEPPARGGGGGDGTPDVGSREVGQVLERLRSALQELHYHAVRIKVVHDHPGAAPGEDGDGELRQALERAEGAADELETLTRRFTIGNGGS